MDDKLELLEKLYYLEEYGFMASKRMTMADSYEDIKMEYEIVFKHMEEVHEKTILKELIEIIENGLRTLDEEYNIHLNKSKSKSKKKNKN